MNARYQAMTPVDVKNRATEARTFLDLARLAIDDARNGYSNASASNAVLAGIAASDAICGHALQRAPQGQDHAEAVTMLKTVSWGAAKHLKALVDAKSTARYGSSFITATRAKGLLNHAERLCDEMDERLVR